MTKLHFDDLTQITCPFGMLDEDTQQRLRACDEVQYFADVGWFEHEDRYNGAWIWRYTFRAKPKPKRLVTWVHWDKDDAVCCETRHEADQCLKIYGGYIYRIERDEDGSNPTIELVEVGGKDD